MFIVTINKFIVVPGKGSVPDPKVACMVPPGGTEYNAGKNFIVW